MEQKVINNTERRQMSDMAIFWLSMIISLGVGLTLSYCSGMLRGINYLSGLPFAVPTWLVITIPPVMFVLMGVALFLTLRTHTYSQSGKVVRAWTWVFWLTLLGMAACLPYAICYNNPVGSYVMSTIGTALALGATVLMYKQNIAAGIVMTVALIAIALIMLYLGFWAFA